MSNDSLKLFLKILKKVGYPNPDIINLGLFADYNLHTHNFLLDLKNEIGEKEMLNFVKKSLDKLSTEKGIKVQNDAHNEEVIWKVDPIRFDPDYGQKIIVKVEIVDSKLAVMDEDGQFLKYSTLEEIEDDLDFGDYSAFSELMEYLVLELNKKIFENCGFGILVD